MEVLEDEFVCGNWTPPMLQITPAKKKRKAKAQKKTKVKQKKAQQATKSKTQKKKRQTKQSKKEKQSGMYDNNITRSHTVFY